jgi:hypothetical protein
MAGSGFHQARLDLKIGRDLQVTLTPKRPIVGPLDEVEIDVTARDHLGRPVAAELSLAMVDRALLRQFADPLPPDRPVLPRPDAGRRVQHRREQHIPL